MLENIQTKSKQSFLYFLSQLLILLIFSSSAWDLFVPTVIWRSSSSVRVCRHNFSNGSCQVISQTTTTTAIRRRPTWQTWQKANKPFDVFIWPPPIDRLSTQFKLSQLPARTQAFVLCSRKRKTKGDGSSAVEYPFLRGFLRRFCSLKKGITQNYLQVFVGIIN